MAALAETPALELRAGAASPSMRKTDVYILFALAGAVAGTIMRLTGWRPWQRSRPPRCHPRRVTRVA